MVNLRFYIPRSTENERDEIESKLNKKKIYSERKRNTIAFLRSGTKKTHLLDYYIKKENTERRKKKKN